MKKILSLCINLLLLIITDAVPLKLIAGDRSIVKKDGATHTISKYYVVPNDFDPNNATNSTEASQKTTLRMNHRLFSKSMDANTASEHQVSENRAENETNGIDVDLRSGLNDTQIYVATQTDDNTAEAMGSVNTEQSFSQGQINVYNSSEALQNGTSLIEENATQTFERDVEGVLNDLILSKISIAVQESSVQNLQSFWKLIKLTIDRISDDNESLAKIKRLSLLLNIFTNLYEAAQLQKPIESMVDSIIDILQIPLLEKSNTNESQSQTDVSGDYDEECLRKCDQKLSKTQLDSNGSYLSETESLEVSNNLELEKLDLQRDDSGKGSVNTSNDPVSNQVTVNNRPTNILRSQLLVPNNLNLGVTDGYNVHSSIPTPTLNHVTRNNDIEEDPKSNQTIPDSAETGEKTDDQPLTIESKLTDDWPRTIKNKSTKNLPWTTQTITTDDLPWHIEDKTTDNLPWHIEDKRIDHQPWIIKHRTTNTLPRTIEHSQTKKVSEKVENRADPNWTILNNKVGHSPFTLYKSGDPSGIPHGGKIQLHPNQHMTDTVHSVKKGVKKGAKKPYHIYTYVINPATSLYEISKSGNIVKVNSRQPNAKLGTKLYSLSTPHGRNKVVNNNKPSSSYYESKFSLSKPSVDISRPSNSQLEHRNYVTYDTSNEVNPSNLISENLQDDYQPQYLVGRESETNHKPAFLQPNTLPLDSQTNSDQENKEPQVPEVASNSQPGVLLPNVPSNPLESLINLGNTGSVSTASANASADTSDVNLDIGDTQPYPYIPNTNLNHIQQRNLQPRIISKPSEFTNLPDGYDVPIPVYGGKTHKHPGLISTASSTSAYNFFPDEYDEPVYGGQRHQHPSLISSSSSAYTNAADDYGDPNPVYGGQTHKYPGFISKPSAHSEYTNLLNDYNNPIPDYGQDTLRHPGLISKIHHYPKYANVVDDYDEPTPVYGGQIHKHPDFISEASSHSEFTNVPNDYNNPTPDYEEDTDRYPVHIQTTANGRPTENEDNMLVSYHPYGHIVHIKEPSLIAHLHGNQPTGLNYLKHLKLKLAPTYRLFTLDNLLKLRDVVIKTIKINGDERDAYDNRALMNLKKIINIILILAEHLEEPEGSIEWYEKIFYNTQKNRHPVEIYVHNLIRQSWLHELMLVTYKNDFNFNILQNPRIFSFLGSWQFPNYVLNFMEAEELTQHNFDAPEVSDQTFSSQHGLHDNSLEEVSEDLENYVNNNVIDSYKAPNTGIVVSIAGVDAEPDANAIVQIIQKYLHYKSIIKKQENVIIRDNKVEMLKQIILFLREKGYGANTIADLIRKLYTAVYSTEGKDCQTNHKNFAKNMYDVVLPVLRRSGR